MDSADVRCVVLGNITSAAILSFPVCGYEGNQYHTPLAFCDRVVHIISGNGFCLMERFHHFIWFSLLIFALEVFAQLSAEIRTLNAFQNRHLSPGNIAKQSNDFLLESFVNNRSTFQSRRLFSRLLRTWQLNGFRGRYNIQDHVRKH